MAIVYDVEPDYLKVMHVPGETRPIFSARRHDMPRK